MEYDYKKKMGKCCYNFYFFCFFVEKKASRKYILNEDIFYFYITNKYING